MLHQPSAKDRTDRASNCRKSRPRAYRLATTLLVKSRADNCQATGYEQRSANSLNTSGGDQLMDAGGSTASGRSHRKDRNSHYEGQAPSEQVSQRSSHQNQRAQKQSVRLDYPLHIYDRRMKAGLD